MKELDREKLSELIIKLRNSRGLSRDEMGFLLGISGKTITRWEKGETLPTMPDIVRICNEFNISVDELFEGQINIDKEVNRRLADVDMNLEKLGNDISELSDKVDKMHTERLDDKNSKEDLAWLWLLLIHAVATVVGYLSHGLSRIGHIESFFVSTAYIFAISYLMIKNRNRMRVMRIFLLYAVITIINLLANYVIYANDTSGVIINPEVLVVNGALYGLRLTDWNNMEALLSTAMLVYIIWIIFCGWHLISKPSNRKIMIALVAAIILLTGFIDVTQFYSVEELDMKYGTTIENLGYHYEKDHHYSLLDHKKVEYVFRGHRQYSRYTGVVVRAADKENYLTSSASSKVNKTLSLSVKGYDVVIRVFEGWGSKLMPYADATVKVNNGYIRVEILMQEGMDDGRIWKEEPLDDDSYIKIFGDLLSTVLKEKG